MPLADKHKTNEDCYDYYLKQKKYTITKELTSHKRKKLFQKIKYHTGVETTPADK